VAPQTPKFRRAYRALCLAALAATPCAAAAFGSDFQDVGQLETLARAAAARELPPITDKQRLEVGPLQPRLRLARCVNPITAHVAPGIRVPNRVLIELRCDSGTSWHWYVPVRVVGTAAAVIAAHAIVNGTVLRPEDLRTEQLDVGSLPQGFLDDPAIAIGLTANRAIAGGAVLTNQELLGTRSVQRGQTVTLLAQIDGMSVRMAGRALSDALVNQRIKVENLSSGRIVEGIARSAEIVEIVFQ